MPQRQQQQPQPRHIAPVRGEAEHVQFDPRPSPREPSQDATTLTGEEMRRRERQR